jgi:hypothetical protein
MEIEMMTISEKPYFLTKQHTTYQVLSETFLGAGGAECGANQLVRGPKYFVQVGNTKFNSSYLHD